MKLSSRIRNSVKSGSSIQGIIVDVFFHRASVKLASNGAILRDLRVIGGPVTVGQVIEVDFTTPKPTIVASSDSGLTTQDVLDLLDENISTNSSFVWQVLTFSQGVMANTYPSDETGLADAFADTGNGDTVYIPPKDFSGDFIANDGCSIVGLSKANTRILGTLTMGGGTIRGIKISKTGSDAGILTALTVDATNEETDLVDLDVYCENTGAGGAEAVSFIGNRKARIYGSRLEGIAAVGDGYGLSLRGNLADVYMSIGTLLGSTAPYIRVVA